MVIISQQNLFSLCCSCLPAYSVSTADELENYFDLVTALNAVLSGVDSIPTFSCSFIACKNDFDRIWHHRNVENLIVLWSKEDGHRDEEEKFKQCTWLGAEAFPWAPVAVVLEAKMSQRWAQTFQVGENSFLCMNREDIILETWCPCRFNHVWKPFAKSYLWRWRLFSNGIHSPTLRLSIRD